MNRKPRKNLDSGRAKNYNMYITMGIVIIAVIAFFVAYNIYGKKIGKQAKVTNVERSSNLQSNLNTINNNEISEVSSSMGRTVNEIENSINSENSNSEKIAINTSIVEENVVAERNKTSTVEPKNSNDKEVEEERTDVPPTFMAPIEGEIIKDYSSDNLIYSNTLEEWTTHLGIDYAAEKTSIVKASADGTVKTIKNDPRYGLTVVLEHSDGFTSMYSNLLSTEFIEVGEKVTKGQTIATVGNTATFEIADETHLHFEILKDGNNVNPNLYIK